jgi:phosphoribosylaminoimidazolecarboxamide formyltransferase / IMP cyclohydrolase
MSIYGGIVVTNTEVDAATATEMAKIFLEIVVAPSFTPEAYEIIAKKKNIRIMRLPGISVKPPRGTWDMKKVLGGLLVQDLDLDLLNEADLKVVTKRVPTQKEMEDLLFGWKVVKHTKSNAIVVAKDGRSLGIGGGQVNRFWPAQQALERSGEKVKGAVMASDAFFPFDDCVKEAVKFGITAIIQPGGAGNDKLSIDACDEAGIAMIFTGMRHFKHS